PLARTTGESGRLAPTVPTNDRAMRAKSSLRTMRNSFSVKGRGLLSLRPVRIKRDTLARIGPRKKDRFLSSCRLRLSDSRHSHRFRLRIETSLLPKQSTVDALQERQGTGLDDIGAHGPAAQGPALVFGFNLRFALRVFTDRDAANLVLTQDEI